MVQPTIFGLFALLVTPSLIESVDPMSKNIKFHKGVTREEKWRSLGHKGVTLWMTGLSGSGKSTVSVALEHALVNLQQRAYFVYRLDGDNLRFGLNRDLGFAPQDRKENVRRVAEVSKLFAEAGAIVVAGLISPYAADRQFARELHENASLPFLEVFIDAPLNVVESRDPKGLYMKARQGQIKGFTGIDAPYELPAAPEIHLRTDKYSVKQCVNYVLKHLEEFGIHFKREFRRVDEDDVENVKAPELPEEGKTDVKSLGIPDRKHLHPLEGTCASCRSSVA